MIWFSSKQLLPWEKWLFTHAVMDGEGGAGGEGGAPDGGGGGPAPAGGEPTPSGGEPTPAAAPTGGVPVAPAGGGSAPDQAALWQEQAEFLRNEVSQLKQALTQLSQGARPVSSITPGGKEGDLFNVPDEELAKLHPAVQAMFKAMKNLHQDVGGIKTQFDTTRQEATAAQEAQQLKDTEAALTTHVNGVLAAEQLPKDGILTNMISKLALQSLRTLHSQGYMISRNVIDSVVGDLVTGIKQDLAVGKTPGTIGPGGTKLPPQPGPGGGGNPVLPAVPTAADRRAALAAALSQMNMEE